MAFTFIIRILVKYITMSVGNTVEPSKSEKKEGSLNSKLLAIITCITF